MIVKFHASGGHSFKSLTEYLVKDESRVEFTETRNLITENPYTAARVMAATAMNQKELKTAAGIKNTGRKPGGAVVHFTLSWKDEEGENRNLDQRHVSGAVDTVLAQLGAKKKQRTQYADEHQVLMVQHNDKDHSHVHVVVNRVHPEHGVMLPDGNNYLKVSQWALKYERETGRIYCPQRAVNWQARNRREYVRHKEDTRKEWEAKKQVSNDNRSKLDETIRGNRKKDMAIYRKGRDLKKSHQDQWHRLSEANKARIADIETQAKQDIAKAVYETRKTFRSRWEERFNDQEAATSKFSEDEKSFLGRAKNSVKAIDFKALLAAGERRKAISGAFDAFASTGARQEAFKRQEAAKDAQLESEQKKAEKQATLPHQDRRSKSLAENRERFASERESLILLQRMETAAFRSEWKHRNQQRTSSYRSHATMYVNERAAALAQAQDKLSAIRAIKAKAENPVSPKQDMQSKAKRENSASSHSIKNNSKAQEAYEKLKSIEEFKKKAAPEQDKDMER